MKKSNFISILYENGFSEYYEMYVKLESLELELLEKDIYIFKDDKRIIIMKAFESLKGAYTTYENIQKKIKIIIESLEKKFRKNVYYFMCVNQMLEDKHIKVINLIEKDQYICKKYVVISEKDIQRISFFKGKSKILDEDTYNNIKVNDIFINLIKKHCENNNSIIYAKKYIEGNQPIIEDRE